MLTARGKFSYKNKIKKEISYFLFYRLVPSIQDNSCLVFHVVRHEMLVSIEQTHCCWAQKRTYNILERNMNIRNKLLLIINLPLLLFLNSLMLSIPLPSLSADWKMVSTSSLEQGTPFSWIFLLQYRTYMAACMYSMWIRVYWKKRVFYIWRIDLSTSVFLHFLHVHILLSSHNDFDGKFRYSVNIAGETCFLLLTNYVIA